MTSIFGSKSYLDTSITPSQAFSLALNMLIGAYGRDDADIKLITVACQNVYEMGRAQGMTEAYENMQKAFKLPENEL